MSLQSTSLDPSVVKLGKDIVRADLIQLLMLPDADGKVKASLQHAGIISESIDIVHVDDNAAVDP